MSNASRFGFAEWFGLKLQSLDQQKREDFGDEAGQSNHPYPCIPRVESENPTDSSCQEDNDIPCCNKKTGVCSVRLYKKEESTGTDDTPDEGSLEGGPLVTVCPERFKENGKVIEWVGETLLGDPDPIFLDEIPFLERVKNDLYDEIWEGTSKSSLPDSAAGQIDGILMSGEISNEFDRPNNITDTLRSSLDIDKINREEYNKKHKSKIEVVCEDWCALEIQSVYLSGKSVSSEYDRFKDVPRPNIPFPNKNRTPDFRSSSVKRLLPQLQTKIPSLRRWGKKMAVVVDEAFFAEMAPMKDVEHLSNSDIVWFVVEYEEKSERYELKPKFKKFTTLEDTVEGLTSGKPVSEEEFTNSIKVKASIREESEHKKYIDELYNYLKKRRDGFKKHYESYMEKMRELRNIRSNIIDEIESSEDEDVIQKKKKEKNKIQKRIDRMMKDRKLIEKKEKMFKDAKEAIRKGERKRLNGILPDSEK